MKNLYNFGFVVLILVVLGCNCQQLKDLAEQGQTTPSPTPSVANTSSSPSPASSPTGSSSSPSGGLTITKYNQIKDGMSLREVNDLIGKEGVQRNSVRGGKSIITTYQWEGNNMEFIICNFTDDKLSFKTQANLK